MFFFPKGGRWFHCITSWMQSLIVYIYGDSIHFKTQHTYILTRVDKEEERRVSNAVYGPVWNCFASHAPGIQLNYELLRKSICIPSIYRYLARIFFSVLNGAVSRAWLRYSWIERLLFKICCYNFSVFCLFFASSMTAVSGVFLAPFLLRLTFERVFVGWISC